MLVAQGNEDFRHGRPLGGDGLGVIGFHVDNLSYIDMTSSRVLFGVDCPQFTVRLSKLSNRRSSGPPAGWISAKAALGPQSRVRRQCAALPPFSRERWSTADCSIGFGRPTTQYCPTRLLSLDGKYLDCPVILHGCFPATAWPSRLLAVLTSSCSFRS